MNYTEETFEQMLKSTPNLVVIDLAATWCGPCKMLAPIMEEISNEISDIKVVKIDVDESPDISLKYGVKSIPTILFIKNGELLDKHVGMLPKKQLVEKINGLK